MRAASKSLCSALVLCLLSSCGKDAGEASSQNEGVDLKANEPAKAAEKAPDPKEVRYENSVVGLEKLATRLLAAVTDDSKQPVLDSLLYSLRLPDYEKWFEAQFGDELAAPLSKEYKPFHDDIGLMQNVLFDLAKNKQTIVIASSYGEPKPSAEGLQAKALPLTNAKKPFRLYSIRFANTSNKRAFHLWYFVHENGSFRYVGKLAQATEIRGKPTSKGR